MTACFFPFSRGNRARQRVRSKTRPALRDFATGTHEHRIRIVPRSSTLKARLISMMARHDSSVAGGALLIIDGANSRYPIFDEPGLRVMFAASRPADSAQDRGRLGRDPMKSAPAPPHELWVYAAGGARHGPIDGTFRLSPVFPPRPFGIAGFSAAAAP